MRRLTRAVVDEPCDRCGAVVTLRAGRMFCSLRCKRQRARELAHGSRLGIEIPARANRRREFVRAGASVCITPECRRELMPGDRAIGERGRLVLPERDQHCALCSRAIGEIGIAVEKAVARPRGLSVAATYGTHLRRAVGTAP